MPASSTPSPPPPSVLILTRNEELNIAECLRCLEFCDDVVVLDSHSTDRTVEIAAAFPNVRVVQRRFDTEYKQRNFGLHEIEYRHPWLYICDADERVPEELRDELISVVNDPEQSHAAFRLRYRNMFLGRWIRHASTYPVWLIRLVRPEQVTYEIRKTNVHPIVDGTIGDLRSHFIHYSFNTGLRRWLEKHNFYSDNEALEGVAVRSQGAPPFRSLWVRDQMVRRRTVKNLSFFLHGRALWRFLYNYFWCFGWLDGRPGLHYCAMVAMYEYWIELKITEQERSWRQRNEEVVQRMLAEPAP